jgi:hypothetical protein
MSVLNTGPLSGDVCFARSDMRVLPPPSLVETLAIEFAEYPRR